MERKKSNATKSVRRFSKLSLVILALVAIALFLLIAPAYIYWFGDITSLKTYEAAIEERYFEPNGFPEPIESKLVKPIVYMNQPQLKELSSAERKKRFIETILPSILIVKHRREQERLLALAIMDKLYPTRAERLFMRDLYETYRAKSPDDLLLKMQTHPNSVAIAQAALESAWGTSRVFSQTNNLFGVWSFNANEPRYLAAVRKKGVKVFVKSYGGMYESVEDYFMVLAVGRSFEEFRKKRAEGVEPTKLVALLELYSEQRKEYVEKLRYVIRSNNLTRFDDYSLDKAYLFLKAAL
jgi:Bax protein